MTLQIELFTKVESENQIVHLDSHGLFYDALYEAFNIEDSAQRNLTVKKLLKQQISLIRTGNEKKGSGAVTVQRFSEMIDTLIGVMWDQFEINAKPDDKLVALVAVGGYGRMEMCPKSDVDLLILTSEKISPSEKYQAEKIVRDLWDFGFEVGSSVRSVSNCQQSMATDPDTCTSFLNERFLGGNYKLYKDFLKLVNKKLSSRRVEALVNIKLEEREQRLKKYGGLVQKLEPNLKEGNGCLRDVHTLLWVACFKYNCRGLGDLVREGLITPHDLEDIHNGYSFLLQARCCLHFITNKKDDFLAFHLQPDVAREFGFIDQDGQKPVEVFLKHFYRHTKAINRITEAIISRWTFERKKRKYGNIDPQSGFEELNGSLELNVRGGNPFKENIALMLEFFDIANKTGLAFGNHAILRIKQATKMMREKELDSSKYLFHFLELCKRTERVGRMLRFMHDAGLLELIIPDFNIVNCHVQYNVYHIYTTDEHTLTVVRQLAYLKINRDFRTTSLKEVFSEIDNINVLIIACIYHDIAKGLPGDHSVVGADLIYKFMKKSGFNEEDCQEGARLVLHHLAMNEIAQRRNLEDPKTIFDFIDKIKTVETLKKLYVLTFCDTSSVHPDAWSSWKANLLEVLYKKTSDVMARKLHFDESSKERMAKLVQATSDPKEQNDINEHLKQMPIPYLATITNPEVVLHLLMAKSLRGKKFNLHLEPTDTHLQFTVVAKDHPHLLACICGVLAKLNISILTASVFTRLDGIVIDTFKLSKSPPYQLNIEKLKSRIEELLIQFLTSAKKDLSQISESIVVIRPKHKSTHVPLGIKFSNSIAENYSTIDISCQDHIGLMFLVSKAFTELQLNVHGANLTTEAGQALDAFYVTDINNRKIEDEETIQKVESVLGEELIGPAQ